MAGLDMNHIVEKDPERKRERKKRDISIKCT